MALRQKHEFTVIELTDLKDDYEKIKKINNTIIENLVNKEPSDVSIPISRLFTKSNSLLMAHFILNKLLNFKQK